MPFELEAGSGANHPEGDGTELLADAITRPFSDIENRLSRNWLPWSEAEENQLRFDMKAYLSKLNANPLIPLRFRLKVMDRFGNELNLLDEQLTAALLNAYSVTVEMLKNAVRSDSKNYPVLVDVITKALETAIYLFRLSLKTYQSPSVIIIRLTFNLECLGLGALCAMTAGQEKACSHLEHLVAQFELLKVLDFFGKSSTEQKIVWQLLQQYACELQPRYFQYQDAPPSELPGKIFLLSNLSRPDQTPEIISGLPEKFPGDVIVIPLNRFFSRLAEQHKEAKRLLGNAEFQKKNMRTEEELELALTGSALILDDLRPKERAKRYQYHKARVYAGWNLRRVFAGYDSVGTKGGLESTPPEWGDDDAWSISDISKTGAGLRRHSTIRVEVEIGAMIGLKWPLNRGEPELGFIRWFREPKPGEQYLGIEFLRGNFRAINASLAGAGAITSMNMIPPWPVMAEQHLNSLHVFSPEKNVSPGALLRFTNTDHSGPYKVRHIIQTGPNYALFLASQEDREV